MTPRLPATLVGIEQSSWFAKLIIGRAFLPTLVDMSPLATRVRNPSRLTPTLTALSSHCPFHLVLGPPSHGTTLDLSHLLSDSTQYLSLSTDSLNSPTSSPPKLPTPPETLPASSATMSFAYTVSPTISYPTEEQHSPPPGGKNSLPSLAPAFDSPPPSTHKQTVRLNGPIRPSNTTSALTQTTFKPIGRISSISPNSPITTLPTRRLLPPFHCSFGFNPLLLLDSSVDPSSRPFSPIPDAQKLALRLKDAHHTAHTAFVEIHDLDQPRRGLTTRYQSRRGWPNYVLVRPDASYLPAVPHRI